MLNVRSQLHKSDIYFIHLRGAGFIQDHLRETTFESHPPCIIEINLFYLHSICRETVPYYQLSHPLPPKPYSTPITELFLRSCCQILELRLTYHQSGFIYLIKNITEMQ